VPVRLAHRLRKIGPSESGQGIWVGVQGARVYKLDRSDFRGIKFDITIK
jgi:hypothetical protein